MAVPLSDLHEGAVGRKRGERRRRGAIAELSAVVHTPAVDAVAVADEAHKAVAPGIEAPGACCPLDQGGAMACFVERVRPELAVRRIAEADDARRLQTTDAADPIHAQLV